MGMVVVARLAARAARVPPKVTMTSTLSATSSVASAGNRSGFPFASALFVVGFGALKEPEATTPWEEAPRKRGTPPRHVRPKVAYPGGLGRRLGCGSERPGGEHRTCTSEERATVDHWIT